jgi:hypothetical protein
MAENKLESQTTNKHERVYLIITVTKRGWGDRVVSDMRGLGITFNMETVGNGVVGKDLADYMGLTEDQCDIVFSIIPNSKRKLAMSMIEYKFSVNDAGHSYAISIPISGVGGPISLKYISGINPDWDKRDAE